MNDQYLWPDAIDVDERGMLLAGHSVAELAKTHGTPLYLFDRATLQANAQQLVGGLAGYRGESSVHYACKALFSTAIVKLFASSGVKFDVVSLNELQMVMQAGVAAADCHLHGNGTPVGELEAAMRLGIGRIVVDNAYQLDTVIALSEQLAQTQAILLRVAPDVVAGGNEKIQTGKATSKFGFNIDDGSALRAIDKAQQAPMLTLCGLHAHTGSQIRAFDALKQTIRRLFEVAADARDKCGWQMEEICPGGGLAVPINGQQEAISKAAYCQALIDTTTEEAEKRGWPLPALSIEPGRSMVARAGVAVYTVTGQKELATEADYLHVDGGIGDNLRPAMYGAEYAAASVFRPKSPPTTIYQIAGRYCESGDILIPKVCLPAMQPGDLIALPAAGAYTLSMASNYNGIGRPAVLLVDEAEARLIQRRERWQDMLMRDIEARD